MSTLSILSCIQSVCRAADNARGWFARLINAALGTEQKVIDSGAALQCVVNGPEDTVCDLPLGGALPTLATALAALNAAQIAGLDYETFTATAGQTAFTLAAAPAGDEYLEAALNGAILAWPTDYTRSGTTLTLSSGAFEDDELTVRVFALS
jgi:hypothetical protein